MATAVHFFSEQSASVAFRDAVQIDSVTGIDAVLARLPELEPIVAGCLQEYELRDVAYFLTRPQRFRATPHLILVYGARQRVLLGGVLLLGYRGLFVAPDRHSRGSVFAPRELRLELAAIVAEHLLVEGARFVSLDLELGPAANLGEPYLDDLRGLASARMARAYAENADWALQFGVALPELPLAADFDETLAPFSHKARKNLRRYQRLATRELGCTFEPNARLSREAFLELASESHYPVAGRTVLWRYQSIGDFANTFLCGLRAPSGMWLSVAGCRRNGTTVEIDWQMNRKGFEAYSLVTALRSSMMQHEGARGTTRLRVEGGDPHQIGKSVPRNACCNLAVCRRDSLLVRFLSFLLPRFFPLHFLTTALKRPGRTWMTSPPRKRPQSTHEAAATPSRLMQP